MSRPTAVRKTTRATKPARRRVSASPADAVRVRMYDVGFGDCFLLWIPTLEGHRKVLIDCGSIKQGGHPLRQVVLRLIQDVTDADGVPRIDVVIGTHRHRDHVSGFDLDLWDRVEVHEVWMPWTEHPTNPQAKEIRDAQSRLALQLHAALTRLAADPDIRGLALNAVPNEGAMQTLHEGFAGRPKRRFLPTVWRQQSTFEPQVLPGVIVHVMGPSRSKEVIRDMNPPAGESYLRLVDTGNGDPDAVPYPFSSDWSIPRDLLSSINPLLQLSPADESDLQKVGKGMEQALTVALDAAINGTSLMLMMKVGQAYLLLPGDAQWGTWRAALDDPEWRPLLAKTTFYKVGHHGSHNATPIEFVDRTVGKDFWAMVSVKPTAKWKSIPKEELLTALRKRTKKLVRSDGVKPATATAFRVEDFFVEAEIPTRVTRA